MNFGPDNYRDSVLVTFNENRYFEANSEIKKTMKTTMIIAVILALPIISTAQDSLKFYDFKATTIDGKEFDFSTLKGKKVLIVNTASKCGHTPQYKDLEDLYKQYGGDKFVIIGFPANNFLWQEPGTNDSIKEFCTKKYGVTFPMMAKISVKGDSMHPLYKWLTINRRTV